MRVQIHEVTEASITAPCFTWDKPTSLVAHPYPIKLLHFAPCQVIICSPCSWKLPRGTSVAPGYEISSGHERPADSAVSRPLLRSRVDPVQPSLPPYQNSSDHSKYRLPSPVGTCVPFKIRRSEPFHPPLPPIQRESVAAGQPTSPPVTTHSY